MNETVDLRLLSRRELEAVVLLLQGYAARLNRTVEEFTNSEWRVGRSWTKSGPSSDRGYSSPGTSSLGRDARRRGLLETSGSGENWRR